MRSWDVRALACCALGVCALAAAAGSVALASRDAFADVSAARARGLDGRGVRVAVFDTGLAASHAVREWLADVHVTRWTSEADDDDRVGHGTFVAMLIAGRHPQCGGIAPAARVDALRVFDSQQASATDWFLDAFVHSASRGADVVNLSIGGTDSLDWPFIDKVNDLLARGVVVISAAGNDGPVFGSVFNPADMPGVVAVGGAMFAPSGDVHVASFSSRGFSKGARLALGAVRPDVLAPSNALTALGNSGRCQQLSGTSVAAPVITGVVALVVQHMRERCSVAQCGSRAVSANAGAVLQLLHATSTRVDGYGIVEQGAGLVNVTALLDAVDDMCAGVASGSRVQDTPLPCASWPRVTAFPRALDMRDCPFLWPWCAQALEVDGEPLAVNITLVSRTLEPATVRDVTLRVSRDVGHADEPVHVEVRWEASRVWPTTGWVYVELAVLSARSATTESRTRPCAMRGAMLEAQLEISVTPEWPGEPGDAIVRVPIVVPVVSRAPRARRVLWDATHSLSYPERFVPRDRLSVETDLVDWLGDSPFSNFRSLFDILVGFGVHVDVASRPLHCYALDEYQLVLLADTELPLSEAERAALVPRVRAGTLSALVLADWYDADVVSVLEFVDQQSGKEWKPAGGGANVPALNEWLGEFGVRLGERVFTGDIALGPLGRIGFDSGVAVARVPEDAHVLVADLVDQSAVLLSPAEQRASLSRAKRKVAWGCKTGSLAVLGDSSIIDDWRGKASLAAPFVLTLMRALGVDMAERGVVPLGVRLDVNALPFVAPSAGVVAVAPRRAAASAGVSPPGPPSVEAACELARPARHAALVVQPSASATVPSSCAPALRRSGTPIAAAWRRAARAPLEHGRWKRALWLFTAAMLVVALQAARRRGIQALAPCAPCARRSTATDRAAVPHAGRSHPLTAGSAIV